MRKEQGPGRPILFWPPSPESPVKTSRKRISCFVGGGEKRGAGCASPGSWPPPPAPDPPASGPGSPIGPRGAGGEPRMSLAFPPALEPRSVPSGGPAEMQLPPAWQHPVACIASRSRGRRVGGGSARSKRSHAPRNRSRGQATQAGQQQQQQQGIQWQESVGEAREGRAHSTGHQRPLACTARPPPSLSVEAGRPAAPGPEGPVAPLCPWPDP